MSVLKIFRNLFQEEWWENHHNIYFERFLWFKSIWHNAIVIEFELLLVAVVLLQLDQIFQVLLDGGVPQAGCLDQFTLIPYCSKDGLVWVVFHLLTVAAPIWTQILQALSCCTWHDALLLNVPIQLLQYGLAHNERQEGEQERVIILSLKFNLTPSQQLSQNDGLQWFRK